MPYEYRKPGVYVQESLLTGSYDAAPASAAALFVGVAPTGPINFPVRCNSWTDYVSTFGSFETVSDPSSATAQITSHLPYAVYSFFQNGGRPCYVMRAVGTDSEGDAASVDITDGNVESPETSFTVTALSIGESGNTLSVGVFPEPNVQEGEDVFTLVVYRNGAEVERFQYLTMDGTLNGVVSSGIRKLESAVNDPYSGSALVSITYSNSTVVPDLTAFDQQDLSGGTAPSVPASVDFNTCAVNAVGFIEGPVILNSVGYKKVDSGVDPVVDTYVLPTPASSNTFSDLNRSDIFIINDSAPMRSPGQAPSDYAEAIKSPLSSSTGDSYVASYTPWIVVPDPRAANSTVTIPPGGAVAGVISRIDSTAGVFRAPAGLIAGITNAVGVDTKFNDTDLGQLNTSNINVIRPVPNVGISIMGARTRKVYGADRYISARRTLIYIKESMKRATQFALFENNDRRLWTRMLITAERILRPLWEAGGLRGNSAAEAFYIKCDESINTPSVIAAGEVRMEIGVALEYPAEFIIIQVSQFENGGFNAQVQTNI